MPLRIRIGNPLDPKALGKNLRILPDNTVATSSGEPVGDPNLPTEHLEQASLVDIGGRTGLNMNSSSGFDLTPATEPTDPKNTFLVLHAEGDTQPQMLDKLSTTGLEIRRGTSGGGDAAGKTEAVIPAYPFCKGYTSEFEVRVPNPNVIPSSFKDRVRVDYRLLNEATPVDATFLSRLSMPEKLLTDLGQLEPLFGEWHAWYSESDPPLTAANAEHPVRMLPDDRERYRFFSHPYYAGVAAPPTDIPAEGRIYTRVEHTCSYRLVWGVSDGSERPQNDLDVEEVLHLGGSPHYLMMFRCVPGGETLVWDVDWVDGGAFMSRFLGTTNEEGGQVPGFVRDYPIWPQASLTDGISDNDQGAFFWGYDAQIQTKRELRLTPEAGHHDQFLQVVIPMTIGAFIGGEGE